MLNDLKVDSRSSEMALFHMSYITPYISGLCSNNVLSLNHSRLSTALAVYDVTACDFIVDNTLHNYMPHTL